MSLFADRLFDALANLVQNEPGQLHKLAGREPVVDAHEKFRLKSLNEIGSLIGQYPFLEYLHTSKILPHIGLCPQDTLPYLLGWMPENLRQELERHSNIKARELPSHPIAKQYIFSSWAKFLDTIGTAPKIFAPTGSMEELLYLSENQLNQYIYAMALYAFEPLLKGFIDRSTREKVKLAINSIPSFSAIDFIRYIQKNRKDLRAQLPYSFPIQLWDGSAESFKNLCEKFGFACFARLIAGESDDFYEELKLHVSDSFWAKIPRLEIEAKPELVNHLKQSFEFSRQYMDEVFSKTNELKSQREEQS